MNSFAAFSTESKSTFFYTRKKLLSKRMYNLKNNVKGKWGLGNGWVAGTPPDNFVASEI
jgi:hypothetical protein